AYVVVQVIVCFAYYCEQDARKDFGGHWFFPFIIYHHLIRPWFNKTAWLDRKRRRMIYKLEKMRRIEAERKEMETIKDEIEKLESEIGEMAFRTPDLWLKQEGSK